MNLRDAFVRDILDNPDDDTSRLIFADWLTERDDPRGEVIRLRSRLAALPEDHSLKSMLREREQELWAAHAPRWVEQAELPLTWDEVIALFRRRLGETVAWCASRAGDWRTPELEPTKCWDVDRQRDIAQLATRRARLLGSFSPQANLVARGRLLAFFPDDTLSDGAARCEAPEYFDDHNVPPWDTWLWITSENDWPGFFARKTTRLLLSWVPGAEVDRVGSGIRVNPEECIVWATTVNTPLTLRLRAAGLLW